MLGRLLRSTTAGLVLGGAVLAQAAGFVAHGPSAIAAARGAPSERQILWQRTLEDALEIAHREKRPLLIAVSMDGESASERIVRERYRDPAFVGMTRPFVCLVASAFRHSARDYDEEGRRIPCPRLGEVTCGEHIALEPILFDKYLGGERIAPRHAVVLPDGTKSFDLSLLFDFRDLDHKLAEAVKLAPPVGPLAPLPALGGPPTRAASWNLLASARTNRGRSAFEAELEKVDEPGASAALDAIAAKGDGGSLDAMRLLFSRRPPPSAGLLDRIEKIAGALHVDIELDGTIWSRILELGPWPGAPGLGEDAALLPLLHAPRSVLLAYAGLGGVSDSERALAALDRACTAEEKRSVVAALQAFGKRPDVDVWWRSMRDLGSASPSPAKPAEEAKTVETLERELSDLDRALDSTPKDPETLARYGRALLALARRRSETGGSGVDLLLKDAAQFLERAWEAGKRDAKLVLDRAKTAYFAGDYESEERFALQGEALAGEEDRIEAERWVGDAAARLFQARYKGDPAIALGGILRGGRALMEVAASPSADETDWISLGTNLSMMGMRREATAVLELAAERLPTSAVVRQTLNHTLAVGGRIDLAPTKAEWIAARNPTSAESAWFAGHAHLLSAENARREEDPARAIADYEKAEKAFRRAVELRGEFAESTNPYLALCALGRGSAHMIADRRADAAKCLVEAVSIRTDLTNLRDGLDREVVDLVDGALEWRESGASPVDVPALVDDLERATPGDATWIRAVCDAELREALRADGRGEIVEGDRYLRVSIDVGRRAVAISGDDETKRALAQSLAIVGERAIARGDFEEARAPIGEAAGLLGEEVPAADAGPEKTKAVAARLRELLGEARPKFRAGR